MFLDIFLHFLMSLINKETLTFMFEAPISNNREIEKNVRPWDAPFFLFFNYWINSRKTVYIPCVYL